MNRSQRLVGRPQKAVASSKSSTVIPKNVPRREGATPWRLQPRSRLLSLPAELRNMIYEYVLVDTTGKRIKLRLLDEPVLTATCRQIQAEALPIFFAENKFTLTLKGLGVSGKPAPPGGSIAYFPKPYFSIFTSAWMRAAGEHAAHMLDVDIGDECDGRFVNASIRATRPELKVSAYGKDRAHALERINQDYQSKISSAWKTGFNIDDVVAMTEFTLARRKKAPTCTHAHQSCW